MSRIGRRPIPVPAGVEVTIAGQTVQVKGPKGELSHTVAEPITIERGDDARDVAEHVSAPDPTWPQRIDEAAERVRRASW